MFENFVSKILVRVLGDYIEDIDVETLSLSIFRGDVELKDLKFKKSALDLFELPVAIIDGHVGKIRVEIPWLSLATEPVRLTIADIFLVVQPKKCTEWDKVLEEKRAFDVKMKKLQHHDALKALTSKDENKKEDETTLEEDLVGKPTFLTRIVEKIANNLQFRIENVHVRFEDNSDHERTIVAGLTLDSFDILSCDDDWNATFVSEVREVINKIVTVNTFSIYMNPDQDVLFSDVKDHDEFCTRMKDLISRNRDENSYVFPAVNSAIKVKMQRAGHIDLLQPKLLADLFVDKIKVTLNETQWKNTLQTVEYVTNFEKYEKYRAYKPKCNLSTEEFRQEWWKYIIHAARQDVLDKEFVWAQVEELKEKREEYIRLYKRSKALPWLIALDAYEAERLRQLERELDFDCLAFYRDMANGEIEKEKQQHTFEESKKQSWGSWVYGWFGSEPTEEEKKKEEEEKNTLELGDEQRQQLYDTIGYTATEQLEHLGEVPREYFEYKLNYHAKGLSLEIIDNEIDDKSIMKADVYDILGDAAMRPDYSFAVHLALGDIGLTDKYNDSTAFKEIITRRLSKEMKQKQEEGDHYALVTQAPLLKVLFETKPADGEADLRVGVLLDRFDVAVNVDLIQKVMSFFVIPSFIDLKLFKKQVKRVTTAVTKQAQEQLKKVLEEKWTFDLNFGLQAPSIIFPESTNDEETGILLLNLGNLHLRSALEGVKERKDRLAKGEEVEESDYYDHYKLTVDDIQALQTTNVAYREALDEASEALSKGDTGHMLSKAIEDDAHHLLEKVSLEAHISQSLILNSPNLAVTKIDARMNKVKANISATKLARLVPIANAIIQLMDNPTGTETKKLKMKGRLKIVRAPPLPELAKHGDGEGQEEKVTFAREDQKGTEYYAELLDGGTLNLFDVKEENKNRRERRPIAMINTTAFRAEIFDHNHNFGMRAFVRDMAKKLLDIDIEDANVWDDKGSSTEERNGMPGLHLEDNQFAIALPQANNSMVSLVFETDKKMDWLLALHDGVMSHIYYEFDSIEDVIDIRYGTNKSQDNKQSDTLAREAEELDEKRVMLQTLFTLDELLVTTDYRPGFQVGKDRVSKEVPLMDIACTKFVLGLIMRRYDITVDCKLEGFNLLDMTGIQSRENMQDNSLIRTIISSVNPKVYTNYQDILRSGIEAENDLVTLSFLMLNDFRSELTDQAKAKQNIILKMEQLHFVVEQTILAHIVDLGMDINENVLQELAGRTAHFSSQALIVRTGAELEKPEFCIDASLEKANILINDLGFTFLQLTMSAVNVWITMGQETTGMTSAGGYLGNLKIKQYELGEDKNKAMYKNMLGIYEEGETEQRQEEINNEEKKEIERSESPREEVKDKPLIVFEFGMKKLKVGVPLKDQGNDNESLAPAEPVKKTKQEVSKMNIKVAVRALRIVYLHRVIYKMMVYFTNGPLMQSISGSNRDSAKQAIQAKKEKSNQQSQQEELDSEAVPQKMLMDVDVRIENPHLIIPVSRLSEEAIVIDLGYINVKNTLTDVNDEGRKYFEKYEIHVNKFNIVTILDKQRESSRRGNPIKILEDLNVDLSAKRTILILDDEEQERLVKQLEQQEAEQLEYTVKEKGLTHEIDDDQEDQESLTMVIPEVNANITHEQYEVFMEVLARNIGDTLDINPWAKEIEEEQKKNQPPRNATYKKKKEEDEEEEERKRNLTIEEYEEEKQRRELAKKQEHIEQLEREKEQEEREEAKRRRKKAAGSAFKIHLRFPKLNIKLLRGTGYDDLWINEDPLVSLNMRDLNALVIPGGAVNRTARISVTLHSLEAHDLRSESLSVHKTFITSNVDSNNGEEKDLLRAMVDLMAAGARENVSSEIIARVEMGNPRIILDPDVVFAMKDFFVERGALAKELGDRHETDIQLWQAKYEQRFSPLADQTGNQGDIIIDRDTMLTSDLIISENSKLIITDNGQKEIMVDGQKHTIQIFTKKDINEAIDETTLEPRIQIAAGVTLILKNVKVRHDCSTFSYLIARGNSKSEFESPVTSGVLFENVVLKAKAEEEWRKKVEESVEEPNPIMILNIEASFGKPTIAIPVDVKNPRTSQLVVQIGAGLNIQTRENGYELYQAELRNFKVSVEHAKQELDPELERQLKNQFTNKRPRKDTQAIVDSFHLIASMETAAHDIRDKHVYKKILLDFIKALRVQISYRDIKLIMQIANVFTAKMNEGNSATQNLPIQPVTDKKEPTEDEEKAPAVAVAHTQDAAAFEEVVTTYNIEVQCKSNMIRLLLVDDIYGYDVPLLDFIIDRIALSESFASMGVLNKTQVVNAIVINLAVYIAAHYYNTRIAEWEPVIEPFGLLLGYEKKPLPVTAEEVAEPQPQTEFQFATTVQRNDMLGPKITTTTLLLPAITKTSSLEGESEPKIDIVPFAEETVGEQQDSKELAKQVVSNKAADSPHKIFVGTLEGYNVFNINVSQEMLRSIVTAAQLWQEDLSGKKPILQELDLYTVRNHSGTTVEFTLHESSATEDKKLSLKPTEIPPGGEYGFNPSNYYAIDTPELGGGSTAETVVLLHLPGSKDQTRITLNKSTRSRGYALFPTEYGPLHITIEFERGRGIITIKSPITIRNQCTMSYEVGHLLAKDQTMESFCVLEPGQTVGIPIQMVQNNLHIRPHNAQIPYQWSMLITEGDEALKFLNMTRTPNVTRFITCISGDNTTATYAAVQPKVTEQRGWELYDYDLEQMTTEQILTKCSCQVEIRPPLALENLLGLDMGYFLFRFDPISNIYRVIGQGELKRGETVFNYNINLFKDEIRVKLCKLEEMLTVGQLNVSDLAMVHGPFIENGGVSGVQKLHTHTVVSENHVPDDVSVSEENRFTVYFDYSESGIRSHRHLVLYSPYWVMNHTSSQLMIREYHAENKSTFKKMFERQRKTARMYATLPSNNWTNNEDMLMRQDAEEILSDDEMDLISENGTFRRQPVMFAFSGGPEPGDENTQKRVCVSVDTAKESAPINVDIMNTAQIATSVGDQTIYPLGIYTTMAPGKYKRTKIITLSSRYRVANGCDRQLELILEGTKERISYMPGQSQAFFLPNNGSTSNLDSVKFYVGIGDPVLDPENYIVSSMPIPLNRLGLTEMKMIQVPSKDTSWMFTKLDALDRIPLIVKKIIHVNIEEIEGCIILSVTTPETSSAPYRVDNDLDQDVLVCQPDTHRWYLIKAHSSLPFSYDDPSLLKETKKETDVQNPDTAGQIQELLVKFDLSNSMLNPLAVNMVDVTPVRSVRLMNLRLAHTVVIWQGTTRVLRLVYDLNSLPASKPRSQIEQQMAGEKISDDPLQQQELVVREQEALLERQQADLFTMSVLIDITAIGISLIDNAKLVRAYGREYESFLPREIIYLYMEGLYVQLDTTPKNQFIDIMIQHLQIDNTDHTAAYPVMFTNRDELYDEPFIRVSLCKSAVANRANTATNAYEEIQHNPENDDKQSLTRFRNAHNGDVVDDTQSSQGTLQEQLEQQPHLEMDTSIQIFPYCHIIMQDATLQLDLKLIESVYSLVSDLMGIINTTPEKSVDTAIATSSSMLVTSGTTTGVNAALMHIDNENQVDTMLLHPVDKQTVYNLNNPTNPTTADTLPRDDSISSMSTISAISEDIQSQAGTAPNASTTATTTAVGTVSTVPTRMYFDNFVLGELNIATTFSFDRSENPRLADSAMFRFFEALGMTLVNIDDAPLSIDSISFEREILTTTDIQNRMTKHFIKQGIKEAYKILGSLNVIGNPLGVFNDVKSGFKGLVKKPRKSTRSTTGESSIESQIGRTHPYPHHRKGDLSHGIAKGGKHFMRNTIHGAFRAASRISYSIGRGISYLTLDRDYARRKEREMLINKPTNTREGLNDASESIVSGFVEGVSGIVHEPQKASRGGGSGWDVAKGVGRGIIGLPMKPIAGIIDSATKTTEGIANGLEKKENVIRKRRRVRYPRTFREDGAITVYDFEEALSQYFLYAVNDARVGWREQQQRLGGGGLRSRGVDSHVSAYAEHERALGFLRNRKETDIYLLTNLSIIKVSLNNEKERWRVGLDTIRELNYNEPFQIITLEYQNPNDSTPTPITKKLTTDNEKAMTKFWTKLNGAIAEVVRKKKEAYQEVIAKQQEQLTVSPPQSSALLHAD